MSEGSVLLAGEAELLVDSLVLFDVSHVGSPRWVTQHERLVKLNMQAVVSATSQTDEFVKDFLIASNKIPVLVHELICVEIWKEKIFSCLIKKKFQPSTTVTLYTVLYQEATLVTLLETVLFHEESVECLSPVAVDLVDYCARKMTFMCSRLDKDDLSNRNYSELGMEDLVKQEKVLQFDICMKVLSIVGFIIQRFSVLPLSIIHRMLSTYDFPLMLTSILEKAFWLDHKSDGKCKKYSEGKWTEVESDDIFKLTKTEGQIWIALLHLLLDSDCQKKYNINDFRKNQLLKLRSFLNEIVIDQIPCLEQLQRYLHYLSLNNPPASKSELIIEQVSEIQTALLKKYEGKWDDIADKQAKKYFSPSHEELMEKMKSLSDAYNIDAIEQILPDSPKCAFCGHDAAKRCSKCKNEWYCRRDCQVKHWQRHKKICCLIQNEPSPE